MNVTRSEAPTVDESRFSCRYLGAPRSGYGLYSEVIAASDRDSDGSDNNKVCGPVRVRTVIIAKAGRQFTNLQWPEIANARQRLGHPGPDAECVEHRRLPVLLEGDDAGDG